LAAVITDQQNEKHIILICSTNNFIDAGAVESLENMIPEFKRLKSWFI
jgi:hypothetical protein